jgi:microcystin-dependent protein
MGEIKIISWNFPPKGWAFCNGQVLPINQNQALFAILGTTYGGNGQTTFALPNLQGRTPVHVGEGIILGQSAGQTSHTLITSEMPAHNHLAKASATADQPTPVNAFWGGAAQQVYASNANTTMNPAAVAPVGGSQPHENMSPYLVLNFVIALQGIFPSQN